MYVIGRKGSFPLKQNTAERSRKPERIPVFLWRDPLPFVNTVAQRRTRLACPFLYPFLIGRHDRIIPRRQTGRFVSAGFLRLF